MNRTINLATLVLGVSLASIIGCETRENAKAVSSLDSGNTTRKTSDLDTRSVLTVPSDGNNLAANSKLERVILQLNWFPEAEHGGFYAAKVHGLFEAQGLDVDIRAGGKTTVVAQELTLERIQFGIANADDVIIARSQTAPIIALMAPIQNGPRCIMVREDSGIQTFEDLKNITLQIDSGRPYVPYMKQRGLLDVNVKVVPYFGVVSQIITDKNTAQQGYSFSEPLIAEQAGVKVKTLMMSDIGYNPYASLLVTSEAFERSSPQLVDRMVRACIEGWRKYLAEPDPTNAYILKLNSEGMTAEALGYGVQNLKPLCLPDHSDPSTIGAMKLERWKELAEQLYSLRMIEEAVDPAKCFTESHLAK